MGTSGITPPTSKSMILPPTAPRSLHGEVVVLLTVDAQGKVQAAEVTQSSGDRGYDSRVRKAAMEWTFNPARTASGQAVAARLPLSFSF
jgi:TonB family protein